MTGLVTGDRNWRDTEFIVNTLRRFPLTKIVNGACRGADDDSSYAARKLKIPYTEYPANWKLNGRAAGPIRNREMYDKEQPDVVLAFHDAFLQSKGTYDMVQYAKSKKCRVLLFSHNNPEGVEL